MKGILRIAVVPVVGLIALSGCAQYNVAGQFEDTGKDFYGSVTVLGSGSGSISVASLDGLISCTGSSRLTERPTLRDTSGAKGVATAQCSDGTSFKVDFIQTTSSGGYGQGISSTGSVVKLYFDTSKAVAKGKLDHTRLNQLVK